MSFGLTDLTGTSSHNPRYASASLLYADAYTASANEYVTKIRVYGYDYEMGAGDYDMVLAVYDRKSSIATAEPVDGTTVTLRLPYDTAPSWHEVDVDPPVLLTEGNTYCRFFTRGQDDVNATYYRISASNYARYIDAVAASEVPDPYGASSSNDNYNYAIEVVTEILSSGPAINPTGTDVTATPGQSRTCVMQNVVATPTAIAYVYTPAEGDPIVSTHTDFVWTAGEAGAGTITYTAARGNLPYGNTNLTIRVTFESGDPAALVGMALTIEADYQVTTAAGDILFGTDDSIVADYTGDDPEAGYQVKTPLLSTAGGEITLLPDLSYIVEYPGEPPANDSIPVELWDFVEWRQYTQSIVNQFGAPAAMAPRSRSILRVSGDTLTIDGVTHTNGQPISLAPFGGLQSGLNGVWVAQTVSADDGDLVIGSTTIVPPAALYVAPYGGLTTTPNGKPVATVRS